MPASPTQGMRGQPLLAVSLRFLGCYLIPVLVGLPIYGSWLNPGAVLADTPGLIEARSEHFIMRTDLKASVATERLRQAERVLNVCSKYWMRQLTGRIHVYYLCDQDAWAHVELPERTARRVLQQVGGGTQLVAAHEGRGAARQAVIYSTDRPGVLEHEVVHAYCFQVFGQGGPDWYREGMAEMLAQQVALGDRDQWHSGTLDLLRADSDRGLHEVIHNQGKLELLKKSVAGPLASADPVAVALSVSPQPWSDDDERNLQSVRTEYAHYWALCYLMTHHRDYQQRFRVFGQDLLSGGNVRFEDAFASIYDRIDFELRQFVVHVDDGYRFDLCQWQWGDAGKPLAVGEAKVVRLKAAFGYQDCDVRVAPGEEYRVEAGGRWRMGAAAQSVDANGDQRGDGRLEIVVLTDRSLSEPAQFGSDSTWIAADAGECYLRCFEDWRHIGDNRGVLQVKITRLR